MDLLLLGHAVLLPPMVNDIADAPYWLQDVKSPSALQCTYSIISKNLLRFCIVDLDHIHPLQTRYELTKFATYELFRTHLG
jgi:hypothetical protein